MSIPWCGPTPASLFLDAKDKDYQSLLVELKSIIAKGQYQAYKAVDNIRVQTYWQIGERIVREELKHKDRADYGKYLVDNLTADLGIGRGDLYRIVKFYRVCEIVGSVSPQLSWTHPRYLTEIDNEKEREDKILTNFPKIPLRVGARFLDLGSTGTGQN